MAERVFLVTGAASGIGAAIARRLAAPGVGLMLTTRGNAAGLAAVADAAREAGAEVETALADLAVRAAPGALVAAAGTRFGRLDGLVSNAGFADRTRLVDLADADFARSLEAITWAFLGLARAALPMLRAGGAGRVVAISSFVAHAFRPDLPVFPATAAAKAAVEALVRAFALEAAPSVTVNAVVPGFIEKDAAAHRALDPAVAAAQVARIPLARLGRPADVAAAAGFLLSREAGYITGQAIHVSGGLVI